MVYKLLYTKTAESDLEKIDKKTAIRILKKLHSFLSSNNPLESAKKLIGFAVDTYRFRIGDYRVIFRVDKQKKSLVILVVLKIVHRKDAYKM